MGKSDLTRNWYNSVMYWLIMSQYLCSLGSLRSANSSKWSWMWGSHEMEQSRVCWPKERSWDLKTPLSSEEREQYWWFATWHCHACVLSESERKPSTGIINLVFPLGCYKQNQYVLMTAAINFIMLHMVTFCTYPVVGLSESNRVYPFKVVNYYKNAEPHDKIHSWMILSLGNIVILSLSILLI